MGEWIEAPQKETRQLFRRMIFNLLVSNHDDHHKNHALLRTPEGYRLSPAYDVVAVEGQRRDQALPVGAEGTRSTLGNALSQCEAFGLEREKPST